MQTSLRCLPAQDADTGLTMAAYNMEIKEFFADAGFTGTPCAGKSIPSLGYAVAGQEATAPGPLVFSAMCAPAHLLCSTLISEPCSTAP